MYLANDDAGGRAEIRAIQCRWQISSLGLGPANTSSRLIAKRAHERARRHLRALPVLHLVYPSCPVPVCPVPCLPSPHPHPPKSPPCNHAAYQWPYVNCECERACLEFADTRARCHSRRRRWRKWLYPLTIIYLLTIWHLSTNDIVHREWVACTKIIISMSHPVINRIHNI